jgi:hypothetical protein
VEEKMQAIEKFLKKLWYYPLRFMCRYTTTTVVALIAICALMIGLSDCGSCAFIDLSYNGVTQSDAEEIVESINCAWSERHKACFCVYANGGAIGGYVPNHICGKAEENNASR